MDTRKTPEQTSSPRQRPTPREREYLEVIFYLAARDEPVIAARISEWLSVSAPTVSATLTRLTGKGLVARDETGGIKFTAEGYNLARAMVRRHRLMECFLVDVLGMPWEVIHEEAVQLEHSMTPLLAQRIEDLVGTALACPHGNPVPGNMESYSGTVRLDEAAAGLPFEIKRIVEEAEEDTNLMAYLFHNGLIPGTVVQVLNASAKYSGVLLQRADDQPVTLSREIAAAIWGNQHDA
jgi:DtxR family Mn-dependent transcriptional regulator